MHSSISIDMSGSFDRTTRKVKVLLYHRIVDNERMSRDWWSCVHVKRFRRHLELLDRWGFTTVTLNDIRLSQEGELNLPAKPVIITFDDGYRTRTRWRSLS